MILGWRRGKRALSPEQGGELLAAARHAGIAIELIGIDSGRDSALARAAGVKLAQGRLFVEPQCDRRAAHSSHRVAYNSSS